MRMAALGIMCKTPHAGRTTTRFTVVIGAEASADLPVETLPPWYDMDDAQSFGHLQDELSGLRLSLLAPGLTGGRAPGTQASVAGRQTQTTARA